MFNFNVKLRPEEKAAFALREIYEGHGYSFYKMGRFEEYDFYADKKDFLTSRAVLTFTDINGKLMALRPDVTLSIIKRTRDIPGQVEKFYYDEKIYRVPRNANTFHEITQTGIECMGYLNDNDICEVLELAVQSLHAIAGNRRCVLDVSHAGLIAELVPEGNNRGEILKCIAEKNIHGLRELGVPEKLLRLVGMNGSINDALTEFDGHTAAILEGLTSRYGEIRADFSAVNNLNYYNGLVFRGFIEGIPESILSGGQYDNLMHLMGHKDSKAVGFAVYLDLIERCGKND